MVQGDLGGDDTVGKMPGSPYAMDESEPMDSEGEGVALAPMTYNDVEVISGDVLEMSDEEFVLFITYKLRRMSPQVARECMREMRRILDEALAIIP